MPRKKRTESPTGIYHWIVRGMNRKTLFHADIDYTRFKSLLAEYKASEDIRVFHYCLMTNHVHLLIQCPSLEVMARFSQMVQRKYAYHYCGTYKWVGSIFQRGYKSICIDKESYLLECARYIERNPLKAYLAKSPSDYLQSSYNYYANGCPDDLLTPSPAYLALHDEESIRRQLYADYVCGNRIQDEMVERKLLLV